MLMGLSMLSMGLFGCYAVADCMAMLRLAIFRHASARKVARCKSLMQSCMGRLFSAASATKRSPKQLADMLSLVSPCLVFNGTNA